MPNFVAISRETFANKCWHRVANFAFASQVSIAPVVAAELAPAAMALPLAFSRQGDNFLPVAVLGLMPQRNFCVGPDGRWLAGYVPASLRSYPFQLARISDDQEAVCIDVDSGLVRDGHDADGQVFFNADGTPSQPLQAVMTFLTEQAASQAATILACGALQAAGVIVPWEIKVQRDGQPQSIDGLFKIDEAALNTLSDEQFIILRKSDALAVAYCQMLSMQRLPLLGQLAQVQAQAAAKSQAIRQATQSGDIDLSSLTRAHH
jgi:hypothetical protein